MQNVQSDDETEYDVDGVYTAAELAADIRRIIAEQPRNLMAIEAIEYLLDSFEEDQPETENWDEITKLNPNQ